MFPSQTSLIPISVAVARFIEAGNSLFTGWYPYWYLGTPAKYLLGPAIPYLLVGLHRILPFFSLFDLALILIFLSYLIAAFGWGSLAYKISGSRKSGFLVGFILLLLPWRLFGALAFSETTFTIARHLLPWLILAFYRYFSHKSLKRGAIATLATAFILLINPGIIAIVLVGLLSLILTFSFKEGKIRFRFKLLKRTLVILAAGFLVASLWYSPGYWLTVLANPSIGGASAAKVIVRIIDLAKAGIPLFMAVLAVFFAGKIKTKLGVFTLTWLLTFLFLSLFRFLGNPAFWMDWTSWLYEVEIGVGFLLGGWLIDVMAANGVGKGNLRKGAIYLLVIGFAFYLVWRIHLEVKGPSLISGKPPEGIAGLSTLAQMAKDKRVFLSGSTVFWADALYNLNQVRGGTDGAAINLWWDHAAYQLREGEDGELAEAWLRALGVSYVLVHTDTSGEYFKDFRNLAKWRDVGKEVYGKNGDIILEMEGTSLVWEVDVAKMESLKPLSGPIDLAGLNGYISTRKRDLNMEADGNKITIQSVTPISGISLLVSYSPGWRAFGTGGQRLKVSKDILGNLLINAGGQKEIVLLYK